MDEIIKEWKTQSAKYKVTTLLMGDGVPFCYNEEDGIMFSAPEFYVQKMICRLMTSYGVSQRPTITEIK